MADSLTSNQANVIGTLVANGGQANLAAELGVAVGSVNWYLNWLIRKGYVKVTRMERRLRMVVEVSDGCGCEADVIVLNDAPPILRDQVLRYGRLLFERDRRARVEFEVLSRKIYFDYKPILD